MIINEATVYDSINSIFYNYYLPNLIESIDEKIIIPLYSIISKILVKNQEFSKHFTKSGHLECIIKNLYSNREKLILNSLSILNSVIHWPRELLIDCIIQEHFKQIFSFASSYSLQIRNEVLKFLSFLMSSNYFYSFSPQNIKEIYEFFISYPLENSFVSELILNGIYYLLSNVITQINNYSFIHSKGINLLINKFSFTNSENINKKICELKEITKLI